METIPKSTYFGNQKGFFFPPVSLLLSRMRTRGKRNLFINEAGVEMLTCAAAAAGLYKRTDGWGRGALVRP